MATSRQFTYGGTEAAPSGTTKTGSLWVGTPNSPERYDLNYGGKIWWMGPDEDNRYIIGKDVPTSDWPAKGNTPPYPHNSGSVRFWDTTAEDEAAFVARVNTLPARQGETPFDDGPQCATWLSESGYWTNYNAPEPGPFFASFRLFDSPTSNIYTEKYLDYCPTEDKMFAWNESMFNQNARGNGIYENISNITQNTTYIVSESNQYLPVISNSGAGMMCFDGSDGYLNGGTHIVKYNVANDTATSKVSSVHGTTNYKTRRPTFESSTNKLFVPYGQYIDIFNTSTLAYSGSINIATYNIPSIGIALTNTDDNEILLAGSGKFLIINPNTHATVNQGTYSNISGLVNGRYNSAEGKYYISGQGSNNKPKILIIDASTYAVTVVEISESGGVNNNTTTGMALDTVRNAIWCMNDDRKIAKLDCATNSVTHYDTTFAGTNFTVMPYVINDRLLIGSQVNNNSGKVYKLTTVISNG
jgi:hypothetical protein